MTNGVNTEVPQFPIMNVHGKMRQNVATCAHLKQHMATRRGFVALLSKAKKLKIHKHTETKKKMNDMQNKYEKYTKMQKIAHGPTAFDNCPTSAAWINSKCDQPGPLGSHLRALPHPTSPHTSVFRNTRKNRIWGLGGLGLDA